MEGWIKICRGINQHWLWDDAEYLKRWIDLLLLAAWEPKKKLVQGQLVEIGRGQAIVSVRSLQDRWAKKTKKGKIVSRPSKTSVSNFLNLLREDEMILLENRGHQITMLTICNYERYQDRGNGNGDTNGDTNGDKIKNIRSKEVKKEDNNKLLSKKESLASMMSSSKNTEYIAFGGWLIRNAPNCLQGCYPIKPLTEEQYTILRDDKGKYALGKQELCDYILSIENNVTYLKKYKSMYLTITNWAKRDGKLKSG